MNLIEISNPSDYDSTMLQAARMSEKSTLRFQLGAVLKDGRKIISKAYNVDKTHTTYGVGRYRTLHAEAYCIMKALHSRDNLNGTTLYVYRQGGLNCRPCPDCQRLIKKFGIKKVIYTNVKTRSIGEA